MNSLLEFLRTTKDDFLKDLKERNADRWTVVMGNEAGDLDSIVSAIAYSYLSSKYHQEPTIALIQTLRNDLYLRPENLYAFSLAKLSEHQEELLCIDDIPSTPIPLSEHVSRFALVDHNRLLDRFQGGKAKVVGIIDHHADERCHLDAPLREIMNPVGSCSSLVTRHFEQDWKETDPPELATLLLSAIYVDTAALKPDDKAVEIDRCAAEFLIPRSTFNSASLAQTTSSALLPITQLFEELISRKRDVSRFSVRDLLRRDYKEFVFGGLRTGLCTVPCSLKACIGSPPLSNFWSALDAYMNERDLAILGVLTTFHADTKPKHRREILLLLKPDSGVSEDVQIRLFKGMEEDATLELHPKPEAEVAVLADRRAKIWDQKNTNASRKYTAPLVRRLLEGEEPTS